MQRARQRRLKVRAMLLHPVAASRRRPDRDAGQRFIGEAAGNLQQILPELLLGIGARQDLGGGVMSAAHVAGMAGVAAAIEFRRAFQHQHRCARPPPADRGAQRSVAAADHQHVEFSG